MTLDGRGVVVVGAGIGGITVALLLAEAGAEVTLLERVAAPAAVGAGILLQPNGLAVLGGLGLAAALERGGHRAGGGAVHTADRLARLAHLRRPALCRLRDALLRLAVRAGGSTERRARRYQQEDPAWLLATTRGLAKRPPPRGQ